MRVTITKSVAIPFNAEVTIAYETDDGSVAPDEVLRQAANAILSELASADAEPPAVEAAEAKPASSAARLLGSTWRPPADVHGKRLRTLHRMVGAVEELTRGGRTATASDISERTRVSLPAVYAAFKPGAPGHDYARRLLVVQKVGRSRVVDLTQEGRYVASLIRAGRLPA